VVPLKEKDGWRDAERHLLDAAKVECTPFMEEAGRQMKLLEQANLLEALSPEPRVRLQLSELGRIHLVLRFPAPDRGRSRELSRPFYVGISPGLRQDPTNRILSKV
jgi:hypothetical protein